VSLLKKFFGLGDTLKQEGGAAKGGDGDGDTETVRRIASELDRLPVETAKFLAAFAYVLARVAHADLDIDEGETLEMERIATSVASLSSAEAALVVQIAKTQVRLLGETENYVVTREFRNISTREQRGKLLQCLYAVAASDGTISGVESAEIAGVGEELGFTRAEINALRSTYRDKLSEFQDR
jgi:uncharacterized tellurite resistance protein B-like protein